MKISAIIMMLLTVSFVSSAQLSKGDIRRYKGRKVQKHRPQPQRRYQPQRYPRYYTPPKRSFSYRSRRPVPADMFVATMTNNVVRYITADLRRKNGSRNRNITWRGNYNDYSVSYSMQVYDGGITREVCVIKFRGMPEVRTVNGVLDAPVGFGADDVARMLYILDRNNICFDDMTFRVNHSDSDDFDELYRVLRRYNYPVKRVKCNQSTQVYINLRFS